MPTGLNEMFIFIAQRHESYLFIISKFETIYIKITFEYIVYVFDRFFYGLNEIFIFIAQWHESYLFIYEIFRKLIFTCYTYIHTYIHMHTSASVYIVNFIKQFSVKKENNFFFFYSSILKFNNATSQNGSKSNSNK